MEDVAIGLEELECCTNLAVVTHSVIVAVLPRLLKYLDLPLKV